MGLRNGLVAYYKLDGASGDVVDETGNYDGTNNGATRGVTGKINDAFDFDGSNDYSSLSDFSDISNWTNHSFSFWVKTTSTDSERIAGYLNDGGAGDLMLFNNESGKIGYDVRGSGVSINLESSTDISDGDWHHVTGTYDGKIAKLYVDGTEEDNETDVGTLGSLDYTFTIGARNNRGTIQGFFDGSLDEVAIWDRALTSSEVEKLYNSGDGKPWPLYEKEESNGILNLNKKLGFNKRVNNLFGKMATGDEIKTSGGGIKPIPSNSILNTKSEAGLDLTISTSSTKIESTGILEEGTYIVFAGCNTDIFTETATEAGAKIWLEKDGTEIEGTERVVTQSLGSFDDKLASLSTHAIVELDGSEEIDFYGTIEGGDAEEIYLHDFTFSWVKIR